MTDIRVMLGICDGVWAQAYVYGARLRDNGTPWQAIGAKATTWSRHICQDDDAAADVLAGRVLEGYDAAELFLAGTPMGRL